MVSSMLAGKVNRKTADRDADEDGRDGPKDARKAIIETRSEIRTEIINTNQSLRVSRPINLSAGHGLSG